MISFLLDGVLSFVLGVWAALIGFGATSLSKDQAKSKEFVRRWGGFLKVSGSLIAVWGLYNIIRFFVIKPA
jgi:hypothetical protein